MTMLRRWKQLLSLFLHNYLMIFFEKNSNWELQLDEEEMMWNCRFLSHGFYFGDDGWREIEEMNEFEMKKWMSLCKKWIKTKILIKFRGIKFNFFFQNLTFAKQPSSVKISLKIWQYSILILNCCWM